MSLYKGRIVIYIAENKTNTYAICIYCIANTQKMGEKPGSHCKKQYFKEN